MNTEAETDGGKKDENLTCRKSRVTVYINV